MNLLHYKDEPGIDCLYSHDNYTYHKGLAKFMKSNDVLEKVVGFDMEWPVPFICGTPPPPVALIQLCTRNFIWCKKSTSFILDEM